MISDNQFMQGDVVVWEFPKKNDRYYRVLEMMHADAVVAQPCTRVGRLIGNRRSVVLIPSKQQLRLVYRPAGK